jgi:hypothetical protein
MEMGRTISEQLCRLHQPVVVVETDSSEVSSNGAGIMEHCLCVLTLSVSFRAALYNSPH